ncbi:MAG: hypothetical protein GX557_15970, partial [Chloroflexi bacterium]|nr:hypothetical protein [Chloroflexota bacterium]
MTNSNAGSNQGKKPVVKVQRRRPSGQTSTGARPRAQAPRREGRTDQQSGYRQEQTTGYTPSQSTGSSQSAGPTQQPSSGQQPSRPAFSIPGMTQRVGGTGGRGCSLRTLLLVVVLIAVVFLAMKCLGGLGDLGSSLGGLLPQDSEPYEEPQGGGLVAAPTAIPATRVPTQPFVAPTRPATGGDNWLIMLYQDADDKVLEKDIYVDLNEAERIGSTDNIQIVTQIDRFTGGYADDGNWTGTRRYYVTQDRDLNRVGSQLIEEIGEANMADGDTLIDFCTWAIKTFPADKVVLIMSDHGMGWPGG